MKAWCILAVLLLAGCDALLPNKTPEDRLAEDRFDNAIDRLLSGGNDNQPDERFTDDSSAPRRSPLSPAN